MRPAFPFAHCDGDHKVTRTYTQNPPNQRKESEKELGLHIRRVRGDSQPSGTESEEQNTDSLPLL